MIRPRPRRRNPFRAIVRMAREEARDETPDETLEETSADSEPKGGIRSVQRRRRGVFLLPNLITTGALFAGFYAIVAGMNGDFSSAVLAIYAAMLLDAADGRVARLTRTESLFGAEYDSLSDMVAFGVAPALLAFSWALSELGQFGWVITFIYMACAALRLARFNTRHDNTAFTGLASPSGAAIIASLVWVLNDFRGPGEPAGIVMALLLGLVMLAIALLMVSNFRYFSPKGLMFKGRVPFVTMVAVVLIFALIFVNPPAMLLLLFGTYALSGPATHLWMRRRGRAPARRQWRGPGSWATSRPGSAGRRRPRQSSLSGGDAHSGPAGVRQTGGVGRATRASHGRGWKREREAGLFGPEPGAGPGGYGDCGGVPELVRSRRTCRDAQIRGFDQNAYPSAVHRRQRRPPRAG
jgi:CDP-diacylglycerol---serine O-phosphatidyltransferase